MKTTQRKDVVRNIRTNVVSWLAVVIVVTITCGVYCGVFFYADALENTAEAFYARTNYEDLVITAADGLTQEEIRTLTAVPGVLDAEGTYQRSGVTLTAGGRSHTADLRAVTERISVPELLDGGMPGPDTECAMTPDALARYGLAIGDEIMLELDGMPPLSFTITGSVRHPDAYYQGDRAYVFVSEKTLGHLFGEDRRPVVLVDAACGGSPLSDTYEAHLRPIRADIRSAVEQLSSQDRNFVTTARADRESFMVLRQVADILRKLSTIFVVIFVVIGAIVITSTITVVIDGQKRQIGFLKSYGFRDGEIIRRYLIYGESAVFVGMLVAVGVAFALQTVIRNVLDGMFCLEVSGFSFRIAPYLVLFILEGVLTGIIAAWVTVSSASKYSAVELLNWKGGTPARAPRNRMSGSGTARPGGTLYSRLIFRNIRSDRVRVAASAVIIAGCCFMIGIGLTLNSAFHSMTVKTRREVANYDLECTLRGDRDLSELEQAAADSGASCARAVKTQTVYGFQGHEEYVTVIAARAEVYRDYLRLVGPDGGSVPVPDTGCVLIQNRISERLGIEADDEIVIFDETLDPHPVTVSGTARNYLGRVMYLSEETYASVFGSGCEANTLLVRLDGEDRDAFADMLSRRFPDAEISFTDAMPSMFSGLTDAFNALIYVLMILSVIMSVFVLLNLVNIFVSRRQNELIIMGINGFSYREEIGYLLRETIATTVAGLAAGACFGALMTKPVVHIIEASDTMCARSVNWTAWAVGMAMEAAFALLINLFAFRRVKHFSIADLK